MFVLCPVQPCGPPKLFRTCVGKHALRRLTTSNRCGKSCSIKSEILLSLEMEGFNFFAPFLHAFIKDKLELTPRVPRNVSYTLFSRLCDWKVKQIGVLYLFVFITTISCADQMSPSSSRTLLTFRRCRKAAASPDAITPCCSCNGTSRKRAVPSPP